MEPLKIDRNSDEYKARKLLMDSYPVYAAKILKIRTKGSKLNSDNPDDLRCEEPLAPLIFNFSQRFIHSKLEAQKKKTGMVRVIILKCRQNGTSTYTEGRFEHKTAHTKGIKAFILTHDGTATNNIFEMVKRFFNNTPDDLRPHVSLSNRKELVFDKLDSSYGVGTAGNDQVGRSDCIQLFHGSECAFWPNGANIFAGLGQAIPGAPGTEIILESTANGMDNFFYQQWELAVAGKSDYIAIFIPWFWVPEYVSVVPDEFSLTEEEEEVKELYSLSLERMAWRKKKIVDFGNSIPQFKQEYPSNPTEAFQFSKTDSFIPAELVVRARKQPQHSPFGAIIAGYDPKQEGSDNNAFVYRQNHNVWGLEYHDFNTPGEQIAFLKKKLDQKVPYIDRLFIDYGGSGWAIAGMLTEDGYGERIRVVKFGGSALNKLAYKNRRAEMWDRIKLALLNTTAQLSLPDSDRLQSEITGIGSTYTSSGQLLLQPKKEIPISLDGADAVALTFAELIVKKHVNKRFRQEQIADN